MKTRYQVFKSHDDMWHWRARDFNNMKVTDGSTQGYSRKYNAVQNLRRATGLKFNALRKWDVREEVV